MQIQDRAGQKKRGQFLSVVISDVKFPPLRLESRRFFLSGVIWITAKPRDWTS